MEQKQWDKKNECAERDLHRQITESVARRYIDLEQLILEEVNGRWCKDNDPRWTKVNISLLLEKINVWSKKKTEKEKNKVTQVSINFNFYNNIVLRLRVI